jgi:hypothetical protein
LRIPDKAGIRASDMTTAKARLGVDDAQRLLLRRCGRRPLQTDWWLWVPAFARRDDILFVAP